MSRVWRLHGKPEQSMSKPSGREGETPSRNSDHLAPGGSLYQVRQLTMCLLRAASLAMLQWLTGDRLDTPGCWADRGKKRSGAAIRIALSQVIVDESCSCEA
jgi:hypothetical protein